MIYAATKEIQAAFTKKELKFDVVERENTSAIITSFNVDNFSVRINFISANDNSGVRVRMLPFVKGTAEKRQALIELCNNFNNRFRYVTFTVDKDSDVCISADFPLELPMSAVGQVAVEYLYHFLNIAKEAYPETMKTLWA